ncbi:MAG: glycosyltransferase family 2 protein [Flavobacteriales bacterium]|nr:glycosyltransferase family 2 protein [Flavobacteriales bacterium]
MSNVPHKLPLLSVVVPCKNEESFMAAVIENILAQDYPKNALEVFLIDGMSTDGTLKIIEQYVGEHDHLHLLINEAGYVPDGLNKAIKKAKGEVILRMDAHSIYPANYFSELVSQMIDKDADNVGGVWDIQPGANTAIAKTIAFTNGHPFGIGNAQYRYAEGDFRWVDTVPFGCYKRSVFDEIGLFDEDLVRNQDDELNARLIQNGGKILLIPSIKIKYFARETLGKMARMFYQYGLYKPLANRKLGKVSTGRQLVPVWFVVVGFIGLVNCIFQPSMCLYFGIMVGIYILVALLVSLPNALKEKSLAQWLLSPFCFFVIHTSYGLGYLKGLYLILIAKKPKPKKINR